MIQLSQAHQLKDDHLIDLPVVFRAMEHGLVRPEGFFCLLRVRDCFLLDPCY